MASFADGKIEGFIGPMELGAAESLEDVIDAFMAGAKESLDIAVQEPFAAICVANLIPRRKVSVRGRATIKSIGRTPNYCSPVVAR